jgi:hypothetical protein
MTAPLFALLHTVPGLLQAAWDPSNARAAATSRPCFLGAAAMLALTCHQAMHVLVAGAAGPVGLLQLLQLLLHITAAPEPQP